MGGEPAARICAVLLGIGVVVLGVTHVHESQVTRVTQPRAEPVMAGTVVEPPTTTAPPETTTTAAPAPIKVATNRQAQSDRVVFDRTPNDIGREALSLITYPWQERLPVSIVFAGPRAGYRAISTATETGDQLVIYVRPTDTPRLVAVNIAHELGHIIDYRHLNDADRQEWLRIRNRPGTRWWTCDYCADYSTGSGDFAETFAAWQIGAIDYRSQVAPLPSPDEMQQLARFFK